MHHVQNSAVTAEQCCEEVHCSSVEQVREEKSFSERGRSLLGEIRDMIALWNSHGIVDSDVAAYGADVSGITASSNCSLSALASDTGDPAVANAPDNSGC